MFKLLIPVFLFFSSAIHAQLISREEAKALSKTLLNSKADTAQINTLLKLATYHVFKPGENKVDLDSAADLIKRSENINVTLKSTWANGYIILTRSYLLRENGEAEKAKENAKQATDILKNSEDKSLAGEAYFNYSGYFDINDSSDAAEKMRLVQSAVSCFEQSGNQEKLGETLHMLGDLYQLNGSEFIAVEKLQRALDVYASVKHEAVQGIYSLLGKIYTQQRDYKKALDYGLLALKTAEKVGDNSIQMCMINNDVGETYFQLGDRKRSLLYHNNALAIAEKFNDAKAIYITASHVANDMISVDKPREALSMLKALEGKYKKPPSFSVDFGIASAYINAYLALKEYSKGEPYCNQVLGMLASSGSNDYTGMYVYAQVIKFYIHSRQYQQATRYLDIYQGLAEKVSDKVFRANNHRMRFVLDTVRHNYQSAIGHVLAYKQLLDSVYSETNQRQITKLQVQYETEKKERDLVIKDNNIELLKKQSFLQQSKIEKDRLTRNAIIVGACLLLLVLILVYSRYIIKQKSNRKLQQQQQQINEQNHALQTMVNNQNRLIDEKEWLLKEIHHRVKNNLQIVMSLLNSQSAFIDNDAALTAIHDSQHRVHAMSLIHQKLYNTENVSSIDMSFYIRELVAHLADSFNTGQRIRFAYNLEPLELDVSQAVPLGLILNEAITNSIKYAFPGDRDGVISISLLNTAPNNYLLTISDNGIGIQAHFSGKKPGSLGISLMRGLSEDLDGDFMIENDNGTLIKISFVHELVVRRPDIPAPSFAGSN